LWTRQNNFGALCPALLEKVSNPCSPDYGHYYTFDQINELTLNKQDITTITTFLLRKGVQGCNITNAPNGENVAVQTSVVTIENIFSTQIFEWQSTTTGKIYFGSTSFTIPADISGVVTYPMGVVGSRGSPPGPPPPNPLPVPPPPAPSRKRDILQGVEISGIDPMFIRDHYNFPNGLTSTGESSSQSVMGTAGQSYSPFDLTVFQTQYSLPVNSLNLVGDNSPSDCTADLNNCFEANLDTQYINSIAEDAPTWFWSIDEDPFASPFLRLVAALDADPNPPDVHSISYANAETLLDPVEVQIFNDEACKLGLRGITLITAAGDFGAPGIQGCLVPSEQCTINPIFPASCPFVTVVGSTLGPESKKP